MNLGKQSSLKIGVAILAVALIAAMFFFSARPNAPVADNGAATLADIKGRPVTLGSPATKLAIDDSRYLVALSLIHPDPVSILSAWPHDVHRLGEESYQRFLQRSPALASLPKIASSASSFDMESLLAAAPDVALLSLESNITTSQIAQLEAAGIQVIFVDFFVDPLKNLSKSLSLVGDVTGRTEQAAAFIAFRDEHMKRIADRVAKLAPQDKPAVFLEAHAGMSADCCNSPGKGNTGNYIDFVGGHNIGADVLKQSFGKLNLEYVVSRDPAVYIATGGPHLAKAGGLVIGANKDPLQARQSLLKVTERRGIDGLSAVKNGRAHGFSHQLINSPLDIVAIEAFARWIHPELFQDISPEDTLAEINSRFLAIPYDDIYWVSLN